MSAVAALQALCNRDRERLATPFVVPGKPRRVAATNGHALALRRTDEDARDPGQVDNLAHVVARLARRKPGATSYCIDVARLLRFCGRSSFRPARLASRPFDRGLMWRTLRALQWRSGTATLWLPEKRLDPWHFVGDGRRAVVMPMRRKASEVRLLTRVPDSVFVGATP